METQPSFGLLCARAVFLARKSAQDQKQPFTIKDAADLIDQLDTGRTPAEKPKKPRKPRTPPITTTDESWLQELERNPVYAGIDIRRELGKAQLWASESKKGVVSRRRLINWLNKVERPIGVSGIGKTSFQPAPKIRPVYNVSEPVPGWPLLLRNYVLSDEPEEKVDELLAKDWTELPLDLREKIAKAAS